MAGHDSLNKKLVAEGEAVGIFDFLFKQKAKKNGVATYETAPVQIGEVAGLKITTTMLINSDEETAALHRAATRLKDEGDWNGAIDTLQKAQARMRQSNLSNTTESWVRLPLFLQQAGRFEEAMTEFNRLLDEVDDLMAKEFSHQPKQFLRGYGYHPRVVIYDKMKLACKRQKLADEAVKYEKLRDEYRRKHETFLKQYAAWQLKETNRRKSMREKRFSKTSP